MDALNRKEAIIMGDDITPVTREEYCLKELAAGGGGGLDYVIPEQTLTFPSSADLVAIQNEDLDSVPVEQGNPIISKLLIENLSLYYGMSCSEAGTIEYHGNPISLYFYKRDGAWYATVVSENAPFPLTASISAIRGF